MILMKKQSIAGNSSKKGDVKELRKFMGVWSKAEGERFQKEIAKSRKRAVPRFFG
jgi:hypothetical protein